MNAVVQSTPEPMSPLATPMRMLEIAVSQNADVAKLEKLMDLHQRWEANEARKAFVTAMAQFKADPPKILKSKGVDIPGGAKFKHATLADVVDGVLANLSRYGLSHRWVTEQQDRQISVTCILTHEAGHSESASLTAPPDDSGKKNTIQQIASTVTYLERYTLMAACGLAAKDMDNDGASIPAAKPAEPEGYLTWAADMDAVAEEGKAKHLAAWSASKQEFRNYATRHDADWWARSKNKAARAGE